MNLEKNKVVLVHFLLQLNACTCVLSEMREKNLKEKKEHEKDEHAPGSCLHHSVSSLSRIEREHDMSPDTT